MTLGYPLLDDYLAFVGARAPHNTWLAAAYDLKVFFRVVPKPPTEVATADVLAFIEAQRAPPRGAEVDAFMAALRTRPDRAMVEAMVLGGLRRCEVLGLRLGDLKRPRAAAVRGRGRRRPPAHRARLGSVLRQRGRVPRWRRPRTSVTDRVFVVLKGPAGAMRSARRESTRSCAAPATEPGS